MSLTIFESSLVQQRSKIAFWCARICVVLADIMETGGQSFISWMKSCIPHIFWNLTWMGIIFLCVDDMDRTILIANGQIASVIGNYSRASKC